MNTNVKSIALIYILLAAVIIFTYWFINTSINQRVEDYKHSQWELVK